jgi:hypothetical protein
MLAANPDAAHADDGLDRSRGQRDALFQAAVRHRQGFFRRYPRGERAERSSLFPFARPEDSQGADRLSRKRRPGQINFSSAGIGSGTQINGEMFRLPPASRATHVPYKGAVDALNDAMTGRVQFHFSPGARVHGDSSKPAR